MSDLASKSFISEDSISLIDFNKSFSFEQESNFKNINNSESILVPQENSFFIGNNDNKICPDINNYLENDIEDKNENNKNYINNNNNFINDFQQNSKNFIPKETFFQNNFPPSPYLPIFNNNQFNYMNITPKNKIKINNNNLPFLSQTTQPYQLNPIVFNNLVGNNNPITPYYKNNINLLFDINNQHKIYKKNNKKNNINQKTEEKKNPPTFLKTENIIKIELLESGEEKRTCVRLFPIPHKYSPYDIVRLIDKHLKTVPGKRIYRSIYVPLIKVIGKNIGYCFVDLVSPKYVIEFYNVFNGLLLKKCKKPCTVIFSDKQNSDNVNENPLREPIFFKDCIKSE